MHASEIANHLACQGSLIVSAALRNPLPGVPLVESPFFDEIFTSVLYTEEERRIARDLHTKGFAAFDFPDDSFDAKAEAIKSNLHSRYSWDQWRVGTANLRIQDAWSFDENVRLLATNRRVIDLLTKLYGRQAWPFQSLSFPVGTQQHFHTDSVHFSSVPERFMCGVWVALEDVGDDQGPLEYYPGSHRWPIYSNEHIGTVPHGEQATQETFHELWQQLIKAHGISREVFRPKKGQALIWAANLLHGGMPHKDKSKTRWSQVTHYYFENCAYFTPMHSDPFRGLVKFRQPVNILTRLPMPNSYSNKPVPNTFVNAASRGFVDEPPPVRSRKLTHRLKRNVRRALGLSH